MDIPKLFAWCSEHHGNHGRLGCVRTWAGSGRAWCSSIFCWCTEQHLYDGHAGHVRIWDVASGTCLHTLEGPAQGIEWLCWHPQGNIVIAGSEDFTTWMWNAQNGAFMQACPSSSAVPCRLHCLLQMIQYVCTCMRTCVCVCSCECVFLCVSPRASVFCACTGTYLHAFCVYM